MTGIAPRYGRAGRAALIAAVATLAALTTAPRVPAARSPLPPLMLWAWERPTDLRGLAPGTGVAFLSQTIHLHAGGVDIDPRRQKLVVSPGTPLLAVTRIEVSSRERSDLDTDRLARVTGAIAATASLPHVRGVQIDFDATRSQRPLYRRLLHEVRRRLGPDTFVSMTALASWCLRDGWLDGLPVDEVVPMLFRLGAGERVPERVAQQNCEAAVGLAVDEPLRSPVRAPRTYVFNPQPWSVASIAYAARSAER